MADITKLSDADLMAALGQGNPAPSGVRSLSDADLMKALQPQSNVGSIGTEIYNAAAQAAGTIADKFNPYSAANAARADRLKNASFLGGMGDIAQGVLDTGKAALAVPALAASPVTGTARSVIGRAYDALAPQFTPQQQQELQNSGVNLPSGSQVADLALMGVRPSGASPAGIVTKPAPVPTGEALKQAYKDVVNDPSVKSTSIPIDKVSELAASATNDLTTAGFRPTPKSAPETFSTIKGLTPAEPAQPAFWDRVQAEMNGQPLPAQPRVNSVSVDDLLAARRALGKTALEKDATGSLTPDALAAKQVMGKIDSLVESYVPQVKDANKNYSAYKRAQDFDLRGQKAQNNAAAANSGMNLENNLRTQVRQILNNPKLQSGYSPEILQAFREFNSGSRTANVLRMVGNALGGGGGWGTVANAAFGSMLGGPLGAMAIPSTGMALKMLGNARALRQFDSLGEMIRANSPLARQTPPIPVGAPNPLLRGLLAAQLPQLPGVGLRPMLGVVPSPADQQQ